jgi:hypothetical protein
VLLTGSNGDARPQVDDAVWQAFAVKHSVALVGCRFTDKPHDQSFIEEYANASQGSGQALIDALGLLAKRSQHPEIGSAPLLLWACRRADNSTMSSLPGNPSACWHLW